MVVKERYLLSTINNISPPSDYIPLFSSSFSTKSTLLRSIEIQLERSSNNPFVFFWKTPEEAIVTESTVGIDINRSLKLSSHLTDTKSNNNASSNDNSIAPLAIDYVAWDFAGQREYSTFHPVRSSDILLPH